MEEKESKHSLERVLKFYAGQTVEGLQLLKFLLFININANALPWFFS
jgi:hypothetical protein